MEGPHFDTIFMEVAFLFMPYDEMPGRRDILSWYVCIILDWVLAQLEVTCIFFSPYAPEYVKTSNERY